MITSTVADGIPLVQLAAVAQLVLVVPVHDVCENKGANASKTVKNILKQVRIKDQKCSDWLAVFSILLNSIWKNENRCR